MQLDFASFVDRAFWALLAGGVGLLIYQLNRLSIKIEDLCVTIVKHDLKMDEHARRIVILENSATATHEKRCKNFVTSPAN